jgi:hypothetical protein
MGSAILSVLVIIATGQAFATPHLATQKEILVQAKHDSSQFCSRPSTHCTYSTSALDEGWSVLVVQVVTGAEGKEGYPVGGHRTYIYSIEGKLQREIPGL